MATATAQPLALRVAGRGILWSQPLAGAALALALPPLGLLPAALAPAWLFAALYRGSGLGRSLLAAWLFLFGFHLAGHYWVGIAFFAEAERFGMLAVPGVLGLAATLALLGALPLALLGLRRWRSPLAASLAFAALWILGELVRGRWGVQFPWNPLSLALSATDTTLQLVALAGTTGASFLLAWAAALAALALGAPARHKAASMLVLALIAGTAGYGQWRLATLGPMAATPDPAAPMVRIVQGNIAQHHKWDPELRQRWFERHLELSRRPASQPLDVVVWPESAVPYPIEAMAEVRRLIAGVVEPDGDVVLGANFYDPTVTPPVLHNSVYAIAGDGEVRARYDKVDLVPFGEFLPFRPLLSSLGLEALAVGSIDFIAGAGRTTIDLEGLPAFSPLVCFEAAFPGRATDGSGRARWLVNVTNDAWFGVSSGPYQHAAMARMRSVETGLPLIRAANTGISLVTDALGRVRASLPLGELGTLDARLPPALAEPPPAMRVPWAPALAGLALLLLGISSEFRASRVQASEFRRRPKEDMVE